MSVNDVAQLLMGQQRNSSRLFIWSRSWTKKFLNSSSSESSSQLETDFFVSRRFEIGPISCLEFWVLLEEMNGDKSLLPKSPWRSINKCVKCFCKKQARQFFCKLLRWCCEVKKLCLRTVWNQSIEDFEIWLSNSSMKMFWSNWRE